MFRNLCLALTALAMLLASVALTSQAASASSARPCVRTAADGNCGAYTDRQITGSNGYNTYVQNNVWNPIPGWHQQLTSYGPGRWHVVARMPRGNTAVVSYPSTSQLTSDPRDSSRTLPLSSYAKIQSSFSENMHANRHTDGEAGYDIWLNDWNTEVMIQHDNYGGQSPGSECRIQKHATFGGWPGVPRLRWGFCNLGGELIWLLPRGHHLKSGHVGILAMLRWLAAHHYFKPSSRLTAIQYGFEICSTGGVRETLGVSRFTLAIKYRKGI